MNPRRNRDMVTVDRLLRKLLCTVRPNEKAWDVLIIRAGLSLTQASCLRRHAEGETYAEIAADRGVSIHAAFDACDKGLCRITRLLKDGQPTKRLYRPKAGPRSETVASFPEAVRLHSGGMIQKDICRRLHISLATLRLALADAKQPRRGHDYRSVKAPAIEQRRAA